MRQLMGAILAGGQSTRMGRDKALLAMPDGRTMLECVADALRTSCGETQIAIVGIPRVGLSNLGQELGLATITDLRPHAGPLGGIEALLASNLAREYLVCPCDVPSITPEVLSLLLQVRDAPATVMRIAGRERFEPLPARICAAALPTVTRLLEVGERSVWHLMETLPAEIVEIEAHQAAALRNVNTPDEFNTV